MRLVTFLLLNALAFNALSAEEPSDFKKGLQVLLELELNRFESCLDEGKADCDDSEVDSFLTLLGEGRLIEFSAPNYPRLALSREVSGEVIVQITVSGSGQVTEAVAISCTSGKGIASLKYRWQEEGRYCHAFRREAERAALKWSYSPITSLDKESYSRYGKVKFELAYSHDTNLNNSQIVEIKSRDLRKISTLKTKKAWLELREFVQGKQDESPVFIYHLATAHAGLRDRDEAVATLERFLQIAKNQYFHFGAQAASTVINARYTQENDDAVVDAGENFSLINYYRNGDQLSKYRVGLSVMRLASSMTLVIPQRLGNGLVLLNVLKDNIELVEDPAQRADLEAQVDAQLDNLKAQIGQIGARAN